MHQIIEHGRWDDNTSWDLYSSDELPEASLITAVFCVAIHDGQIILMRAERGWGMLGGHIEDGEKPYLKHSRGNRKKKAASPQNIRSSLDIEK